MRSHAAPRRLNDTDCSKPRLVKLSSVRRLQESLARASAACKVHFGRSESDSCCRSKLLVTINRMAS